MLVLDLDRPEDISGSLAKWTSYINEQLIPMINSVRDSDSTASDHIERSMNDYLRANALIIKKKALMDDYNGGPLPIISTEGINTEEIGNTIEFSLGVPLLIVGNKYDRLNAKAETLMLEHVQYSLRKTALKYGASLLLGSSMNLISTEDLISYLSIVTLNKEINPEVGVTVRLEYENMMIPFGFDSEELIQDLLGRDEVINYVFTKNNALDMRLDFRNKTIGKKLEKNIIPVREFLKNCKLGKISVHQLIVKGSNGMKQQRKSQPCRGLQYLKEAIKAPMRTVNHLGLS